MIKNGISINGIIFLLIIFLLGGCVAVKPLEKNSISGQTTNDEEMFIELAILYDQITSDVTTGSADCWKSILTDRSIRLECKYDLVRAIHANSILTGSDNDKTNQAIKKRSLYSDYKSISKKYYSASCKIASDYERQLSDIFQNPEVPLRCKLDLAQMIILKVPSQASSITTEGNEDVGFQDRLRDTLDCHRFHEAFHEYLNILPKLQEISEGAAGNEESLLLAVTAAHGQSAWCEILKDAKIPSNLKMDLITTIHENSTILETTPSTDIIKKEQNSRHEEDFAQ